MKFLNIFLLVVTFLATFTLGFKVRAQELGIKTYDIGNASSLPVIANSNTFPNLSAQGVVAIDADSNVTLFDKNSEEELYPASTTKIITALVSLDYYKPGDVLTVYDTNVDGQKMGLLRGEQMTFENLLNGLLIYSANDAAITLSDNYPGGREGFLNAMNTKVNELHLNHSHFANPVGLDDQAQYTTARDMVRVSEIAMQNPIFAKIVGTKEKVVTDTTGKFTHDLTNVNQLLGSVDGVIGVKTGYTEIAKENLVTNVVRNGHSIFIAILASDDRFGDTTQLINWIFDSYSWQKVGFAQKAVGMILR